MFQQHPKFKHGIDPEERQLKDNQKTIAQNKTCKQQFNQKIVFNTIDCLLHRKLEKSFPNCYLPEPTCQWFRYFFFSDKISTLRSELSNRLLFPRNRTVTILPPVIMKTVNVYLESADFLKHLKEALVRHKLKKDSLDFEQFPHFWPISNLKILSKTTEKAVAVQLIDYLHTNGVEEFFQSAYELYYYVTLQLPAFWLVDLRSVKMRIRTTAIYVRIRTVVPNAPVHARFRFWTGWYVQNLQTFLKCIWPIFLFLISLVHSVKKKGLKVFSSRNRLKPFFEISA